MSRAGNPKCLICVTPQPRSGWCPKCKAIRDSIDAALKRKPSDEAAVREGIMRDKAALLLTHRKSNEVSAGNED